MGFFWHCGNEHFEENVQRYFENSAKNCNVPKVVFIYVYKIWFLILFFICLYTNAPTVYSLHLFFQWYLDWNVVVGSYVTMSGLDGALIEISLDNFIFVGVFCVFVLFMHECVWHWNLTVFLSPDMLDLLSG